MRQEKLKMERARLAGPLRSACGDDVWQGQWSSKTSSEHESLQHNTNFTMLPTFTLPLPGVGTLADCANWNLTVEPYIPQLYELPGKFLQNAGSLESLKQLYISTNPLIMGFAISLALAPIFLVVSEINKNYSQVDRVWSILPSKSSAT